MNSNGGHFLLHSKISPVTRMLQGLKKATQVTSCHEPREGHLNSQPQQQSCYKENFEDTWWPHLQGLHVYSVCSNI